MKLQNTALAGMAGLLMAACSSNPPLETVDSVDLDRFMGDWYVIAHIPTPLEDEAFNAIESYALNDDGTVATTFTFREGGFEGERKEYTPVGFPDAETDNAVWGMRFIWPIKADYRVIYLDDAYEHTVIGRNARDYVWLMARTAEIAEADRNAMMQRVREAGYELDQLREVPQRW